MMTMRSRRLAGMLVLAALLGGTATAPALADEGRHRGWRHHERHGHERRERHAFLEGYGGPRFYAPPPVVVAPPVVVPPPGINLVFPLTFR